MLPSGGVPALLNEWRAWGLSRWVTVRQSGRTVKSVKPQINRLVLEEWQGRWRSEPECALKRLRPGIETWESSTRQNRIEEIALARLRIGHCYATHSHLLTGSDSPVCTHCKASLSVRHVLSPTDCGPHLREPLDDVFYGCIT